MPKEDGQSKCHKMHFGKVNANCPDLKIKESFMQQVQSDTYLGDIIASDGCNDQNISKRVSKGMGLISHIFDILRSISLGPYYFKIAISLRESLLVNWMLYNSEV